MNSTPAAIPVRYTAAQRTDPKWKIKSYNGLPQKNFCEQTDDVALEPANHLAESHTRFKKLVRGNKYKVVEPVLPMDVLGIYILLPQL